MKRRTVLLFALLAIACSKKEPSAEADASATSSAVDASTSMENAESAVVPPTPPPLTPKKYTSVLHTGDSMVGGGLARALGPKFEADGTKYHRDVIESGTIHEFSQKDHLPKLLARYKPDLIVLTLGSNHVPHTVDPDKELGPYVAKLLKRVEGIDCYWVAPPIWKPSQAKFNAWLADHVAPCRFYDGSHLDLPRRPDKIHPNEKGGEIWADDFWSFYKGDGAFLAEPDASTAVVPGLAR